MTIIHICLHNMRVKGHHYSVGLASLASMIVTMIKIFEVKQLLAIMHNSIVLLFLSTNFFVIVLGDQVCYERLSATSPSWLSSVHI